MVQTNIASHSRKRIKYVTERSLLPMLNLSVNKVVVACEVVIYEFSEEAVSVDKALEHEDDNAGPTRMVNDNFT